jgi:hypothetical protein
MATPRTSAAYSLQNPNPLHELASRRSETESPFGKKHKQRMDAQETGYVPIVAEFTGVVAALQRVGLKT